MPDQAEPTQPADVAILEYLSRERADYDLLIAQGAGLLPEYAEERFDTLTERGLIEPVSAETVYRITERGAVYADAYDSADEPAAELTVGHN
jgi:predicted transcriptional regulator